MYRRVLPLLLTAVLLLSGCTTTTDHFYVFPRSAPREFLDVEIDEARRIGVRFHPTRGSMSLGRSQGGLPPDRVVFTASEKSVAQMILPPSRIRPNKRGITAPSVAEVMRRLSRRALDALARRE